MSDEFLVVRAPDPAALMILAHGAGAPMDSEFMNDLAEALSIHRVTTVRFEFPYMAERRRSGKKKPPDRQGKLLDCWHQVFQEVKENKKLSPPGQPLLIGGKSMGGRMASLVADDLSSSTTSGPGVAGLCCFGYPFHPPGKPEKMRTEHFPSLQTPCLILQGTRDPFGKPGEPDTGQWSENIAIHWLEDGNHDFKPRKSSGRTQQDVIEEAAASVGEFVLALPPLR